MLTSNHRTTIIAGLAACYLLLPYASQAQEPFDCAAGIEDAEDLLRSFKTLKVVSFGYEKAIREEFNAKNQALEKVLSAYSRVIKECSPELSVESHYKQGEAYESYANWLLKTPRPCLGLGTIEGQTYAEYLLESLANPRREKALEQYRLSVELAENGGITTIFSKMASDRAEKLEKLVPMIREFIEEQKKLEKAIRKIDCKDAYEKAEDLFHQYLTIKIKPPEYGLELELYLDWKTRAYKWVEIAYENIIRNCDPKRVVDSHFRLECALENFADFFTEAPVSKNFTPEQRDIFRDMLDEKATSYLEKAKARFEAAIKLAEEKKVKSMHVRVSREKLERINRRIKPASEEDGEMRLCISCPLEKKPDAERIQGRTQTRSNVPRNRCAILTDKQIIHNVKDFVTTVFGKNELKLSDYNRLVGEASDIESEFEFRVCFEEGGRKYPPAEGVRISDECRQFSHDRAYIPDSVPSYYLIALRNRFKLDPSKLKILRVNRVGGGKDEPKTAFVSTSFGKDKVDFYHQENDCLPPPLVTIHRYNGKLVLVKDGKLVLEK